MCGFAALNDIYLIFYITNKIIHYYSTNILFIDHSLVTFIQVKMVHIRYLF